MSDELKRFNVIASTGDIEGAQGGLWCEYEQARVLLSNAAFDAKRDQDRIRTLEAELAQAKADRDVLALCVLQFQQSAGIKEADRHPLVADALSRAGGKT